MQASSVSLKRFADSVIRIFDASTTTEETYYPALKDLISACLEDRNLPFDVRTGTSERRAGRSGIDRPDIALYDGADFASVLGEVKLPTEELTAMSASTERNDQIGRYLAQTGIVLLTNVRSVGLLACRPRFVRVAGQPVPPESRDLLHVVDLWSSITALQKHHAVSTGAFGELADLLERAVTEFAPIADPQSLARILARQARRAKADLPRSFTAVQPLLEDYRLAPDGGGGNRLLDSVIRRLHGMGY
jgi:hypothetical protein